MNYIIKVTPANKNFPEHIWEEGGGFYTKSGAEFQAGQMRVMKDFDNRKKFYDKVEVIPNPVTQN